MKTREMENAERRRKKYEDIRQGNRCRCGRYKWPGFSFCRGCTERLPEEVQRGLYAPVGQGYEGGYDGAVRHLEGMGVPDFSVTGKIQGRPAAGAERRAS